MSAGVGRYRVLFSVNTWCRNRKESLSSSHRPCRVWLGMRLQYHAHIHTYTYFKLRLSLSLSLLTLITLMGTVEVCGLRFCWKRKEEVCDSIHIYLYLYTYIYRYRVRVYNTQAHKHT